MPAAASTPRNTASGLQGGLQEEQGGLQGALDRGALILTPTAFAAATLRTVFNRRQRAAGLPVWQPPNVLSWQQWLGSLWTGLILQGHETRFLLNPDQEELLWRDIIALTLDPVHQTSAPGFAQLARSAFARAAAFGVTSRLASFPHTSQDTEQFAAWAQEFTRTCVRHECLPPARLAASLREHLQRGALPAPPEIHLVRFLDVSPADADLLQALRRAGTGITEHSALAAPPGTRLVIRAPNQAEEVRAAAHWLRGFFDGVPPERSPAGAAADVPSVHVAFTDPAPDVAALDSLFREVLAPELNLLAAEAAPRPWELAGGRPLASQPIIATLLRLFRGAVSPLEFDDITALLLSSHLGGLPGSSSDRDTAAQFDSWALRERPPLRPEMTLNELSVLAGRFPLGQGTLAWLVPFLGALREGGDLSAVRTYATWTTLLRRLAAAAGWPGRQPLSAAEFAAMESWDHLLDGVASLDFAGRRVPFAEALAAVEHRAATATFSLPVQAPIQVVSVEEAAASPADVLLLLHGTDSHWPPASVPHPLLPWQLQAAAGMPGANPERDAVRLQRLTEALFSATPHVLITYATEVDEAPQSLAPALAQLQTIPPWHELPAADFLPAMQPSVAAEQVSDSAALPPLPSSHVPGGARVLQLQAACGFRAFAEIRLRSTEPRTPELGIDAGRAGALLHRALDHFWERVPSQAALNALSEEEGAEHLAASIQTAFDADGFLARSAAARDADPWDRAYQALQMKRLFNLLREWLDMERRRAPFTVLRREQEQTLAVGPLDLKLRIDRVDQVDGGAGTVLIDYKTGYDARPAAWETDRPDQPQLPLYALLSQDAELRGLAFARIRPGQLTWAGLQTRDGLLGKAHITAELDQLVAQWRVVLTRLAQQFSDGDHSVYPKSYPDTCTRCGQRFLCRLEANTLLAAASEEAGDEPGEDAAHG